MTAVDCDLFERLHEFARPLEIGYELIGGVAPALEEFFEPRAPQRTRIDLLREFIAPAGKARAHRQADADRAVPFVRPPRDRAAQCGPPLRGDGILLPPPQLSPRRPC